jgi:DNA-directed RNA polymerase subunit RPC12/RpoP
MSKYNYTCSKCGINFKTNFKLQEPAVCEKCQIKINEDKNEDLGSLLLE